MLKHVKELANATTSCLWTVFVFGIVDELFLDGRVAKKLCDLLDGKGKEE